MCVYFLLAWFFFASFSTSTSNKVTTESESSEEEVHFYKTLPPYSIIMIYNVTQEENERCDQKVADIGHKLGIETLKNDPLDDVEEVYRSRIPKNMFPKPIVVRMVSRKMAKKWEKAYEDKKRSRGKQWQWHLAVGQPNDTAMLKEAVEDYAKEMKFPHVWLDDMNTTVFYTKKKFHHNPTVYKVKDMAQMNDLLRNGEFDHLFEKVHYYGGQANSVYPKLYETRSDVSLADSEYT